MELKGSPRYCLHTRRAEASESMRPLGGSKRTANKLRYSKIEPRCLNVEKHTVIRVFFFFLFFVFVVAVVNTPVAMKPFLLRKEQVSGVHFLIDTYLQSVSIKFCFLYT